MILSFLLFFLVLMRKIPTFDKAITYAHAHRLFLRAVALRAHRLMPVFCRCEMVSCLPSLR